MTKKREHRAAAVTDVTSDGRTFTARAVAYGVVDDYETQFASGVFNESLEERLPVIAWSHDWSEPIGRVTDWENRDDGLYITAQLSDPDDVPRARQARSQLADGTLTDVSVGFMRRSSQEVDDGVVEITTADLDEISIVLRGAVPGAQVMSVRSGQVVDVDAVIEVAKRKAAGELTDAEAQAAVDLLGGDSDSDESAATDSDDDGDESEDADDGGEDADIEALDAELDLALAVVDRGRPR